jgi:DNA polymerase I
LLAATSFSNYFSAEIPYNISEFYRRPLPIRLILMRDAILFGKDDEAKIITAYQTNETTIKIVKRVQGTTVAEERRFYPFFFVKDFSLLNGFDKKLWKVKLAGTNYYQFLCIFRKWSDMKAALQRIADNLYHDTSIPDFSQIEEIYVKLDPVYQFLMQTGITSFKDMEFSELKRMQLDIETFSKSRFSVASRPDDRIILISLSDNSGWEHVIDGRQKSEGEMLSELVQLIQQRDPDVIEGHNIYNFDIPYIMTRCAMNKIKLKIGRDGLEPRTFTSRVSYAEKEIEYSSVDIPGRHVIDTWLLVQSYDATKRELESYGLKNVAKYFGFASDDRTYIDASKISETWITHPDLLVKYALDDVRETRLLAEHLSQTNFYLAQILPYNYGQISKTGSAAKIESLFVREYLRKKHSIPKPQMGRQTTGGYTDVFLRGVAGPIIHADVESLYPSIMISYKISPSSDQLGVFQKTLRHLTKLRLETKKQMKSESDNMKRLKLDAMQSSMKILINSFYGYLGYPRGIFNDYLAADMVTETGQKILRQLMTKIITDGGTLLEVDTDGLYFVPPLSQMAHRDKPIETAEREYVEKLSRILPDGINLSLNGRYEKMLSYKKKNYALLAYDGKVKIRGSALISRSMERFGRSFISEAIELILHDDIVGLHKLYNDYVNKIMAHQFPTSMMVRTETVRESIDEYSKAVHDNRRNRTASFEAAINAGVNLRAGEKISYYIVSSDSHQRLPRASRAFANARIYADESEDKRDYSIQYYLKKLNEYANRFSDLFEPEDFHRIFSSDSDSLFHVPLAGIKPKTVEVGADERKIEEEDEE